MPSLLQYKSPCPASLSSVNLKGAIAEHFERLAYHRISSAFAHNVVYHEAEEAFRQRLDDTFGADCLWQGEFWGKWIISAVLYCEYSGDLELKEFIQQGVRNLIKLQTPDGYLGTYRDPMNVFVRNLAESLKTYGVKSKWNWNIWCRKYTLWGLLEAHRLLGDEAILQAASKLANHLIDSLAEHGISLSSTGTLKGIPSGSILKPMLLLYRATNDSKYLEFAKVIVSEWMNNPETPNLITNALGEKPLTEWHPAPPEWAKAYEMMSCFEGVIELYRITGERSFLESAIGLHSKLKARELNHMFSVGFNDIFYDASSQINGISEACDVIHWMRLCSELFLETGNPVFMDDFELAFYNGFLASVCKDGKWGARGARSHGRHYYVFEQAKMKHNHCCVNNLPRGFINYVQMAVTAHGDEVSVNLYSPFEAELSIGERGTIKLDIDGEYLRNGEATIRWIAEVDEPVNLRMRIPRWATTAELHTAGQSQEKRDGWFEIEVQRGSGAATVRFGRSVVVRHHEPPNSVDPWYPRRWNNWEGEEIEKLFKTDSGNTVVYGPLLLARSTTMNCTEEEMFGPSLPSGVEVVLRSIENSEVLAAFEAEICCGGRTYRTQVCDFASAANFISDKEKVFSIFI